MESRHSAPKMLLGCKTDKAKLNKNEEAFIGSKELSVHSHFDSKTWFLQKHRAPTQNFPDGPQGPQQGQSLFRGSHQKTVQVSSLFWCGVPIFYYLTTSELLLQATKVNIVLTLSARSYIQTNSDYRLLFPVCPCRISLFYTQRIIF